MWSNLQKLNIKGGKSMDLPAHLADADKINNFFLDSLPTFDDDNRDLINMYTTSLKNHSCPSFLLKRLMK